MSKEKQSEYYDTIYKNSKEYNKPFNESRYIKLWASMEGWLQKGLTVIDVGCGVGQTMQFLSPKYKYVGIDFSKEAIEKAEKLIKQFFLHKNISLINEDILKVDYSKFEDEKQFFICETLEHIEKDLELLEKINNEVKLTKIVISVPSFNDASHVRFFKNQHDVINRYTNHIKNMACYKLGAWFIAYGYIGSK